MSATHPLYDAYARNSDGESSWDAAQSVNLPKIERVRAAILHLMRSTDRPMHHMEIDANVRHMMPGERFGQSTIRTRVAELKKDGLIELSHRARIPEALTHVDFYQLVTP